MEDILRIALLGTICACDDYGEIHDFVCERHPELCAMGFLELANGILSIYTIREDQCRVRTDDAAVNLSATHKDALELIKNRRIN